MTIICPHCGHRYAFSPGPKCTHCGKEMTMDRDRQPLTVKEEGTGTTSDTKFRWTCRNCGRTTETDTLTPRPCPYCGADYRPNLQPPTDDRLRDAAGETYPTVQLQAQVSTAINIRRIALVLILAVFLTIGSTLVGLVISVSFAGDIHDAKNFLNIWLVIAVLVLMGGLYAILFDKHLTKS